MVALPTLHKDVFLNKVSRFPSFVPFHCFHRSVHIAPSSVSLVIDTYVICNRDKKVEKGRQVFYAAKDIAGRKGRQRKSTSGLRWFRKHKAAIFQYELPLKKFKGHKHGRVPEADLYILKSWPTLK